MKCPMCKYDYVKKQKRVVLGEGIPYFNPGQQLPNEIGLNPKPEYRPFLQNTHLIQGKKIRLIAEILTTEKK